MRRSIAAWLTPFAELALALVLVAAAACAALGAALLTGAMWAAGLALRLLEPASSAPALKPAPVRRNPRGWTVDRSSGPLP